MQDILRTILSYTIFFPCIVGLVRLRTIPKEYQPFLFFIFAGTLAELLATLWIIPVYKNTGLLINLYSLAECILLLLQFYQWRLKRYFPKLYWVLPLFFLLFWIIENLQTGFKTDFFSYFRMVYPCAIVLLSINEINYMVVYESRALFKNAKFLICLSLLIFFAYQILLVASVHLSRSYRNPFTTKILSLHIYINTCVNIFYGIALLFIPGKKYQFWKDKLDRLVRERESDET